MENSIYNNIIDVKKRIGAACGRAGRDSKEVTLIAVSKLKPFEDILKAKEAGVADYGENYVQELTEKITRYDELKGVSENQDSADSDSEAHISWHMIGHLQRNKVKYIIGKTALIHSVDSVSLAKEIEKESAKKNVITKILLEVNVAGEESKWGFTEESVKEAAAEMAAFSHVKILGLMTSAPITEDPESNRLYFRKLNALAHKLLNEGLIAGDDPSFTCPVLSMGMTGDFEVAVEEGATMVRVGTAIFGSRN